MENTNKVILTAEQEEQLRQPIGEYVGKIQEQVDALRAEGSTKVQSLRNELIHVKNDKTLDVQEANAKEVSIHKQIEEAKVVENQHKDEIKSLIGKAEGYLKENYKSKYLDKVNASCDAELDQAKQKYTAALDTLKKEHDANLAKLSDKHEIKDENYVYKNRQFDAKMTYQNELQEIKDRRHEAFTYQYHLIDNLRMSRFTFGQKQAQKWENYRYTFNKKQFFLKNGLYIVIVAIFIFLAIITPVVKHTQLFTVTNVLNILQQASPRMFLALGVAGLILLTGTDLSVGRMVGMGMVTATIIMHQGINTGAVFGHIFDFTSWPLVGKALFALLVCIILTTAFATVAGFFMAKFRMHPFISTMSNMLIIFGIVTYATKGVSFGAIDAKIPQIFIPKINGFPTIILWAVAAIFVVWFIWNKTTLGKNLYAVGGNPEAATVSGISVFKTTLSAFILAGIMYGIGAWLECNRMVGSGSAAYGQGWDMDAIAACVVGGVSFTGGIGKISGVVVGVLIFTSLTYSLTILGIDTNLQFVFEGIIILAAVTLDCLKYVQKK